MEEAIRNTRELGSRRIQGHNEAEAEASRRGPAQHLEQSVGVELVGTALLATGTSTAWAGSRSSLVS